jgi:hypothetical protein
MTKYQSNNPIVDTPKGLGELDRIYISELGFLMIKIKLENGCYIGYNLGEYDPTDNIFSKEIYKGEK